MRDACASSATSSSGNIHSTIFSTPASATFAATSSIDIDSGRPSAHHKPSDISRIIDLDAFVLNYSQNVEGGVGRM